MRTPFAMRRQIQLAIEWYGSEFVFSRSDLNGYGEPVSQTTVATVSGIYHASNHEFVELINQEGISVKSKINKGILCSFNLNNADVQQRDAITIGGMEFHVTAVEPIMYNNQVIAHEISLEEVVEGIEEE